VIGNHDILDQQNYHAGRINIFKKMTLGPFQFVHDIEELEEPPSGSKYVLSGHIHPAVQLNGKGRQRMKLPCFYFGSDYGILPAFGGFTGTHVIEPKQDDQIFIIADNQIMSTNKLKS
jgi:metallophosphoesterase superfamily enzyme